MHKDSREESPRLTCAEHYPAAERLHEYGRKGPHRQLGRFLPSTRLTEHLLLELEPAQTRPLPLREHGPLSPMVGRDRKAALTKNVGRGAEEFAQFTTFGVWHGIAELKEEGK